MVPSKRISGRQEWHCSKGRAPTPPSASLPAHLRSPSPKPLKCGQNKKVHKMIQVRLHAWVLSFVICLAYLSNSTNFHHEPQHKIHRRSRRPQSARHCWDPRAQDTAGEAEGPQHHCACAHWSSGESWPPPGPPHSMLGRCTTLPKGEGPKIPVFTSRTPHPQHDLPPLAHLQNRREGGTNRKVPGSIAVCDGHRRVGEGCRGRRPGGVAFAA